MHPKDLSIDEFSYDLPNERIASYPADPRDSSKLLIYNKGNISEDIYRRLDTHLSSDNALIFNDTKVIKSRIHFHRKTGALIEVFCLEPYGEFIDYPTHFQKKGSVLWKCMIRKAGKWKEKELKKTIEVDNQKVTLTAEKIEQLSDAYVVKLSWTPTDLSFGEILPAAGNTPLPPYIKRAAEKQDDETYQTVYASHKGSVAAPTAGLHFTEELMHAFKTKDISTLFTTLHVGAGTFKPVKTETMEGHTMHSEWMNISTDFLESLLEKIDQRIISVGTTATRTLESIYWMGNKILNHMNITEKTLKVTQWEVYEKQKIHSPKEAIAALLQWIRNRKQHYLMIETEVIIAPGYEYKIVNGLITNFHQPKSTLLLLVSALIGEDWRKVYAYALKNNFRFLSYGDGCLLMP
ncbi:MAG TPA: S-adenosylmethionine:tRNA ribosyltransferase-isomerase [Chitinophagaceae bacterium]|nr:S-adenosylmethionine:tRNA ribosyltransferase-isomerase [Chitinophagaceae bacterium]